ncbi:MAG: hypothetical protein IJW79_08695 [Clostridia bacterium]|nr:hypothetical protein [Clostridia bacterium]
MKNNVKNIVTSVVFLVFIFGIALVCWFKPASEMSFSERRTLEQFPEFSVGAYVTDAKGNKEFKELKDINKDKPTAITVYNDTVREYIGNFEDYSLDQFPLRDTMRSIKAFFDLNVFNKKDNNNMYQVDGYISEMQPNLNKDSVSNATAIWNKIYNNYLDGKANKVLVSVIPDKNYYMAKQNGYLAYDYNEMFEFVKEQCPNFEYVDISGELSKDSFYKTDTHWSQDKIVGVAKKLAEALGVYDEYSWEYKTNELDLPFYGVYAGKLNLGVESEVIKYLTNDVIDGCKVYDYTNNRYTEMYNEKLANANLDAGKDPYDFFLSGAKNGVMRIDNPNQDNGKTLVIFRDSFGSSFAPLMAEGYSTIYVVDIRVTMAIAINSVVGGFEGKDVLFLASSMVVNDSSEFRQN